MMHQVAVDLQFSSPLYKTLLMSVLEYACMTALLLLAVFTNVDELTILFLEQHKTQDCCRLQPWQSVQQLSDPLK